MVSWFLPLWIVIFMPLHIMIHHEKSWWLLKHLFVFIAFHDRSWSIMMYTQGSWKIMMVIETVMMYHELLWCIMNPYGKILKDFVNNHEKSWSIMICTVTFQRGWMADLWRANLAQLVGRKIINKKSYVLHIESGGHDKKKWVPTFFSTRAFLNTSVDPPFKESTDHGLMIKMHLFTKLK